MRSKKRVKFDFTQEEPDLNRLGLFKEEPYILSNDFYEDPPNIHSGRVGGFSNQLDKDENMKYFKRLFENESYEPPVDTSRKNYPYYPPTNVNYCKTYNGIGNEEEKKFLKIDKKPVLGIHYEAIKTRKGFFTQPPKKGTGYGYANVTIGEVVYPIIEPYDDNQRYKENLINKAKSYSKKVFSSAPKYPGYFGDPEKPPNFKFKMGKTKKEKKPTLTKSVEKPPFKLSKNIEHEYPEHMHGIQENPYYLAPLVEVTNLKGEIFKPATTAFKTLWTPSIIATNLKKGMHAGNYNRLPSVIGTIEPSCERLLDYPKYKCLN